MSVHVDLGVEDMQVPLSQPFANALADELVALTNRLGDLAFELGNDPATLRRHMGSLQAIDLVTQVQLAIADILRSTAPIEERVAGVTLETLRETLARAA